MIAKMQNGDYVHIKIDEMTMMIAIVVGINGECPFKFWKLSCKSSLDKPSPRFIGVIQWIVNQNHDTGIRQIPGPGQ